MIKKLFETEDVSLQISLEIKLTRCVFGVAFQSAPVTKHVAMKMVAIHFACFCFTFTRFFESPVLATKPKSKSKRKS